MTIESMEKGKEIITTINMLKKCRSIFIGDTGADKPPVIDDGHCCADLSELDEETYNQLSKMIVEYSDNKIEELNKIFENL